MNSIVVNEQKTFATIDGIMYRLTPHKMVDEQYSPKLQTLEDCWNKVNPRYLIRQGDGTLSQDLKNYSLCSHLPSAKTARQIQAAIKLFVVWVAINGEWYPKNNGLRYFIYFNQNEKNLQTNMTYHTSIINPFPFKTYQLADKAIDIAKDIWLEYFGVEQ